MEESWIRWVPLDGLEKKYVVDSVTSEGASLRVLLHPYWKPTEKIVFNYEGSVRAHKHADETLRVDTVRYLNDQYGKDFYCNWTFFKVINSPYMLALTDSQKMLFECVHYVFIAGETALDVIASSDPHVEVFLSATQTPDFTSIDKEK